MLPWGDLYRTKRVVQIAPGDLVAVGTPVTRGPPHRSRRALLAHRAPTSGSDAQALVEVERMRRWQRRSTTTGSPPYPLRRTLQVGGVNVGAVPWLCPRFPASCPFRVVHIRSLPGSVSGTCFAAADSPWSAPFALLSPQAEAHPSLCSGASPLLWGCPTSHGRASPECGHRPSRRAPRCHPWRTMGSPSSRTRSFRACKGSPTALSPRGTRDNVPPGVAFRGLQRRRHPGFA